MVSKSICVSYIKWGLMLITVMSLAFVTGGCGKSSANADAVYLNGVVYTADKSDTVAEAVAVKDGKITYVGSSEDVNKYIGSNTTVTDLKGKMIIPGMFDTHYHMPITKAYERSINLDGVQTIDETISIIKTFIANNPDMKAYYGYGYPNGAFPGLEASNGPRKERLDAICKDKPIAIMSVDGYNYWLNSKALEIANITKDTPVPVNGEIPKDPVTGDVWGILKVAAMSLYPKQEFTEDEWKMMTQECLDEMTAFGYTGLFSITADRTTPMVGLTESPFKIYKILEDEGNLNLRIVGSKTLEFDEDPVKIVDDLKILKKQYEDDLIRVNTIKIFTDGTADTGTALLNEPYAPEAGFAKDNRGMQIWDWNKLKKALLVVNGNGFQAAIHSIGDGATHENLRILSEVKKEVPGDFRNSFQHLQLVQPEDMKKMAELGVIANVQPYWNLKEPGYWDVVDRVMLGEERANNEYPMASLIKAGVVVSGGSDSPVTPIPNPFWAIETEVTRNLNNPEFYGVDDINDINDPTCLLNKKERISVMQAIKTFTINGAYEFFMDDETGSIEVGKSADMVILDKNLLKINPLRIDSVKVLSTIFKGKEVYSATGSK